MTVTMYTWEADPDGYNPVRCPIPPTTGDLTLLRLQGWIVYWSFRETTGSASARFELQDGGQQGAESLLLATLAAGESFRDFIERGTLPVRSGLYLNVDSGSIDGLVVVKRRPSWVAAPSPPASSS